MICKDRHGFDVNPCDTPLIAHIELHHNKYGSGEWILHFIEWADTYMSGEWQDRVISEAQAKKIIHMCRPTIKESEYDFP